MTYDHRMSTNPADAELGPDSALDIEPELPEAPHGLRLDIYECYPGKFACVDADNYDGLGDIYGSGDDKAAAAGDWAEQYADREVVAKLTEAWDDINALGGTTPKGDKWSAGYNAGIDAALELLESMGAKTRLQRRQEADR